MTACNIDDIRQLLDDASGLDLSAPQYNPTFMQIAGRPHLEDVISNTLRFFMDPKEPHELGTLFLEALLDARSESAKQNCPDISSSRDIKVEREHSTKESGSAPRIDLWVESDTHIIAIENKIYAASHNPLKDYYAHAKDQSKGEPICCYLCLNRPKLSNQELHNFEAIEYRKFLDKIEGRLGNRLAHSDQQHYTPFVLDFLRQLKYLSEGCPMNESLINLFKEHKEHKEVAPSLVNSIREDSARVKGEVKKVKGEVEKVAKGLTGDGGEEWNIWAWDVLLLHCVLVCDYVKKFSGSETKDMKIAIDAVYSITGEWDIFVFSRQERVSDKHKEFWDSLKLKDGDTKGTDIPSEYKEKWEDWEKEEKGAPRVRVAHFEGGTGSEVVVECLKKVLEQITSPG